MSKGYGQVYVITNNTNGKQYVGQTTNAIADRFSAHKRQSKYNDYPICRAFKKYGFLAFEIFQIDTASNRTELDSKEIYWIKKLNTLAPNGYNAILGTPGNGELSQESKEKKARSMRQRWKDPEYRRQIIDALTGENNPLFGKELTASHKRKLSSAGVGKEIPKEQRKKISKAIKNKWQTEDEYRAGVRKGLYKAKAICSKQTKNVDTNIVYSSAAEAGRQLGISKQNISKCCTGQRKTSGGYRWEYI